jgi:ABC-type transport system substrate-binding protein
MRGGVALLVAVVLVTAGCAQDARSTVTGQRPVSGGSLRYPLTSDPASITPLGARTVDELTVERSIFSGLVDIDPGTGRLTGVAAASWKADADQRTFTFTLRQGMAFSNGEPLTADTFAQDWAIVCSVNAPAAPLLRVIEGAQDCGRGGTALPGVRVVSPQVLQIRLSQPFADLPALLAAPSTWAFPPDLAGSEQARAGFERQPVGSGPFTLTSWAPGSRIVLARNPSAVGGIAHLDTVEFSLLPKADAPQAAMDAYRRGSFDVAEVPPGDVQLTMTDPSLSRQLLILPLLSDTLLRVPAERVPSLRQRRGLAYGMDSPTVARSVTGGSATVADGLIPVGTPGYVPGVSPYVYDPGVAGRYLTGAALGRLTIGAPEGLDPVASTLAAGYRELRVPAEHLAGRPGRVNVYRLDAAYPSPDALLAPLASPASQDLLRSARATAEPVARAALYQKLASQELASATDLPIVFNARALVISPKLSGAQFDFLGLPHLQRWGFNQPPP